MQHYSMENIRNVVLLSHGGAGKTSLSEAILFTTGVINRLGKVDDGTTTSDFDPDEVKRKISINLSLLPFEWKNTKINLIDVPGYFDFLGEVKAGMRVSEGTVIVVSAAAGVEVGTEKVWGFCEEGRFPRMIFVNKMDRENASFQRAVEQIQAKFGAKCVPVQLPIGSESAFQGVVDFLTMKSYTGSPSKEGEVPQAMKSEADTYRARLVEAIASADDTLIEKYLNDEQLTLEELHKSLRQSVKNGAVVPVLAGSALQNMGISPLMDAIQSYLPSPKDRKVTVLNNHAKGETQEVEPSEEASLAALVFKTSADPYVGKLTYFRVYTGSLESNSQIWNSNKNEAERIGQLFVVRGKTQEPVPALKAGDIGGVAKLNVTATGDTLCKREKPVQLPPIVFPDSTFSMAVYPRTKADIDKLGTALARLAEEDPTFFVRREPDTNETVIWGLGETQLEVAAEKMLRKFGVAVELKTPKVPYKETILVSADAEHKHKKQTGGHGQYGHVVLRVEPLPSGTGHQFESAVVGGTIPRNYIPAVEKGVHEALQEGVLAGYPVVDVKTVVTDGSYHPVDSSEICFKIAGAQAVKKGLSGGQPVLLEPIMDLEVTIPDELTGDIIGDLNTKRAHIQGMNPSGGTNIIQTQAPLAEVQRYAIDLKSMTQGRGSFKMKFSHYKHAPAHITQQIIADRQAEKEAAKA
ncbi:MAG: elongation factor G [Chloroflexi bacterium]|nr:elongation factor G [Chloroflexota bacterium]